MRVGHLGLISRVKDGPTFLSTWPHLVILNGASSREKWPHLAIVDALITHELRPHQRQIAARGLGREVTIVSLLG